MKTLLSRAVLTLLMCFGMLSVYASDTDKQDLYWLPAPPLMDAGGDSFLTRTDTMILIVVEVANLVPGDAHTLWWIVFNNPAACYVVFECGESDIFNPDGTLNEGQIVAVGIAIGNATGNVAKADGSLEFGGRLIRGAANNPEHQVLFGAGFGDFVLTADAVNDAEVHIIVQTHGQARGGKKLMEQLTYVDTNCTPECADIQFTIHRP